MGLSETLKAISAPVRREILDYLKSGPSQQVKLASSLTWLPQQFLIICLP